MSIEENTIKAATYAIEFFDEYYHVIARASNLGWFIYYLEHVKEDFGEIDQVEFFRIISKDYPKIINKLLASDKTKLEPNTIEWLEKMNILI